MATSNTPSKQAVQTFEFTKRKRWSETLFSEVSETMVLVLSPTCKVLFCGAAIVGLLGWKEDQLVDSDLTTFIEAPQDEDQDNFRWSFTESLRSAQEMLIYARFKLEQPSPSDPNSKPGQLFEVKAHPHFPQGQSEPQCVFLTAMPYPSRNIATLNTFLDLKIENERLSQRISELKESLGTSPQAMSLPPSNTLLSSYGNRVDDPSLALNSSYSHGGTGQSYHMSSAHAAPGNRKDLHSKSEAIVLPSLGNFPAIGGEDDENCHRKKKPKKILVGEEQRVCVTCGRTDSPEWRKGPLGPKTLCNACGLRWAKRSRKPESESDSPVQASGSRCRDRGPDDGPLDFPHGVQQPNF